MARSSSRPHSAVDIRRWIISCGGPADTAILLPLPPTSQTTRIWNTFLKRGHSVPSSLPLGGPHIAHRTSTYLLARRLAAFCFRARSYTTHTVSQHNLTYSHQASPGYIFFSFFSFPHAYTLEKGGWTGELGPTPASTRLGITVGRRRHSTGRQLGMEARFDIFVFGSPARSWHGQPLGEIGLDWTGLDCIGLGRVPVLEITRSSLQRPFSG